MHDPNGYSRTWVQVRVRAWGSASSVLRARVNVQIKLIVLKKHWATVSHYVDDTRLVRKVSSNGARTMYESSAFHILTFAGKNECLCASTVDGGR